MICRGIAKWEGTKLLIWGLWVRFPLPLPIVKVFNLISQGVRSSNLR